VKFVWDFSVELAYFFLWIFSAIIIVPTAILLLPIAIPWVIYDTFRRD
jgi:hypothetical protein